MKLLIALFLCAATITVSAQNDLLVLKKKDQTIQTWVRGSFISFQFSSKQWIQGRIKQIWNDSLLIDQQSVTMVPNQFGFFSVDTLHMGLMKLHVKEIYGMEKRSTGGSIFTNGALLQIGGGGYIFLNIMNSLIKKDQVFSSKNLTGIGIAAGVFLVGKLLEISHSPYIVLGKKYRMEILNMSVTK